MTSSPNSAGAKFEAAIYAALSAAPDALPAILPACSGWEDALWARLLTEVGAHVADEQRKRNQGGPAKPMPIQVLRHALALSADACGDSPVALFHASLQTCILLLRGLLLPQPAVFAATAPLLAEGVEAVDAQLRDLVTIFLHGPVAAAAGTSHTDQLAAAHDFLRLAATGDGIEPPPAPIVDPTAATATPRRLRAHSLRFGAHLSLFLRPLLGFLDIKELQPETEESMRRLRSEYVALLGAAAAAAGSDNSGSAVSLFGDGGRSPTLAQLSSAVALLAQSLEPEEALVEGIAGFLCKLPPELPLQQMQSCFEQVDRLLPTEQRCLLPHIALRVVTYRQAQPLPPPSQPAALVAATRASLLAVNWLLVQPASDAGDGVAPELDDWVVLQALTQALLFLRRAADAIAGTAESLDAPLPILEKLLVHCTKIDESNVGPLTEELLFWFNYLRASKAITEWRCHLANRPNTYHDAASAGLGTRDQIRSAVAAEEAPWREGLRLRVVTLHTAALAALTSREAKMRRCEALPSVARVHSCAATSSMPSEVSRAVVDMHVEPPEVASARSRDFLLSLRARLLPSLLGETHLALLETARATGDIELANTSLALADLAADDRYRLWRHFDRDALLQLLNGFRASAMTVLEGVGP